MTFSKHGLQDVTFHTLPQDAGQMVETSYGWYCGTDADGPQWLIRKLEYSGTTSFSCRRLAVDDSQFEPQDGVLPNCTGPWVDVLQSCGERA